jgi:cell division protein FtsQ
LFSESAQYRRREPGSKAKKAVHRKFRVKIRHVVLSILGILVLFLGIQQGLLFLMGWDRLTINTFEVQCSKPELKAAAERWVAGHVSGNLWVLNIKHLRRSLEAHPWIKAVQVRKHFPSTLCVDITERVPAALLMKDPPVLIDRDGVELAPAAQTWGWDLPLFEDINGFRSRREEKLTQAWDFLDQLPPQDRAAIQTVDVSLFTDLRARRRDFPAVLYLGRGDFADKMTSFHEERRLLESQLPLEYVDLSRADQVAWRTQPGAPAIRPAPERR